MAAHQHLPSPSRSALSAAMGSLARLLQRVAFWLAIGLSAAYPVAMVYPDASAPEIVISLIVLHAVMLLLGHGHARD